MQALLLVLCPIGYIWVKVFGSTIKFSFVPSGWEGPGYEAIYNYTLTSFL